MLTSFCRLRLLPLKVRLQRMEKLPLEKLVLAKHLLRTLLLKLLLQVMVAQAMLVQATVQAMQEPSEDICTPVITEMQITKRQFLPVCDQSHE